MAGKVWGTWYPIRPTKNKRVYEGIFIPESFALSQEVHTFVNEVYTKARQEYLNQKIDYIKVVGETLIAVAESAKKHANLLSIRQILSVKCNDYAIFPINTFNFIDGTIEVNGRHAGQKKKSSRNFKWQKV